MATAFTLPDTSNGGDWSGWQYAFVRQAIRPRVLLVVFLLVVYALTRFVAWAARR